ncbi:MAG: cytochrome c [Akkermansiaceae bacterium]
MMNIFLAIESAEGTEQKSGADLAKIGQQQYMVCGACHGQQGEGTAAGPPLAGSEWVNGPAENLINIQLRGLTGPIMVKGQEYNFPAGMQPMAYQTDEQIAGVLTYVRSNFGNDAPPVAPAEVEALRGEVGKPQLTADQLIPVEVPATTEVVDGEAPPVSNKYEDIGDAAGLPWGMFGLVIVYSLVCVVGVFKK